MDHGETKTLADVMPGLFSEKSRYGRTKAYKMRDEIVVVEHCLFHQQDEYLSWPGKHKSVFMWVKLENGYVVGLNENPARGWSFPVHRLQKEFFVYHP